jgi:hypothetical protein
MSGAESPTPTRFATRTPKSEIRPPSRFEIINDGPDYGSRVEKLVVRIVLPRKSRPYFDIWCCDALQVSFFGMFLSDVNRGAFQSDFVVPGHIAITTKDQVPS